MPSRTSQRAKNPFPADAATPAAEIERLIFDHISDAIFATDRLNRVTYWSGSAERLFGYSASEAVGHPFGELLPFRMAGPEDERDFFEELAAGRTWRGRGTVRLRDGREIWLESTVQPIVDAGQVVGSVSVARDISETIDAQRNLAEQERFINAVLDVEGALVVVLDAQGRVVRFNGACERLSGYRSAELIGRSIWDVIPPVEVGEVPGRRGRPPGRDLPQHAREPLGDARRRAAADPLGEHLPDR